MSLKDEVLHGLGLIPSDVLSTRRLIALRNVIKLSRERIWMASGQPIGDEWMDCDVSLTSDDLDNAERSLQVIEQMLIDIEANHEN